MAVRANVRLAADANVLLSAVLGGRAKLVLDQPSVYEIITTTVTLGEVEETPRSWLGESDCPSTLS